jgi:alpha-D-ribose 1-methylphosphonate 5-triphosphate diphosphatase
MAEFVLGNARIVTRNEIVTGSLAVREGRVSALDTGATAAAAQDLDGDLLIPGLVELHTDNFERHMMPRPKVYWPEMPALLGHDAELAAAGITTVYDALGVGDSDMAGGIRGRSMEGVLAAIDQAEAKGALRAEHRLHVRVELPAPNAVELFRPFEAHHRVGLISLMDHTPGQRQWENLEQARIYYTGKKGWSDALFDRKVAEAGALQERYVNPHRRHFVEYARGQGIALASHDDTKPEHVEEAHAEGVVISEFPTRIEAARAAHAVGMTIVMGAPNVVRGGSHSGNVAAVDLARLGLLDSLSSDYVPASLLMAAFKLTADAGYSLPQAVATVSLNPARAVGLADRGEIALGLRADLVQVRLIGSQPVVRAVWREGRRVA